MTPSNRPEPRRAAFAAAVLACLICLLPARPVRAADWVKDDAYTADRAAWYRDARFGMFIHWGLYAVPAGEYNGRKENGIGDSLFPV